MYETLRPLAPDAILKLMDLCRADSNPNKVDLGIGVYQNDAGETPVLSAVKKAEALRNEREATKTYFGPAGDPQFGERMRGLILGAEERRIGPERARVLQTPGGSGALRVAGELIRRAAPEAAVWLSDPTWANHAPLLSAAGLRLQTYPYYDHDRRAPSAAAMLECLRERAAAGDVVLLHGSCHNPTGADLTTQEWTQAAAVCAERGLIPFLDIAYHGFAAPLEKDLAGARALLAAVPEAALAYSCSKNFGLYRDRAGALLLVGKDKSAADAAFSNAYNIVRAMYSVPPHHGAALVTLILADKSLYREWNSELDAMRERIAANRESLATALEAKVDGGDFDFLRRQNGMFSLLGVDKRQAAALIEKFSIYLLANGRVNLAGVKPGNVDYIAEAVARALG